MTSASYSRCKSKKGDEEEEEDGADPHDGDDASQAGVCAEFIKASQCYGLARVVRQLLYRKREQPHPPPLPRSPCFSRARRCARRCAQRRACVHRHLAGLCIFVPN